MTRAETSVLLLKLGDASPKLGELDLTLIARVLGSDAIPVSASLLAFLR